MLIMRMKTNITTVMEEMLKRIRCSINSRNLIRKGQQISQTPRNVISRKQPRPTRRSLLQERKLVTKAALSNAVVMASFKTKKIIRR